MFLLLNWTLFGTYLVSMGSGERADAVPSGQQSAGPQTACGDCVPVSVGTGASSALDFNRELGLCVPSWYCQALVSNGKLETGDASRYLCDFFFLFDLIKLIRRCHRINKQKTTFPKTFRLFESIRLTRINKTSLNAS